jgi:hypothetical protein
MVWQCMVRRGRVRFGWLGEARLARVWLVWFGKAGETRFVETGLGLVWRGVFRLARLVEVGCGMFRRGFVRHGAVWLARCVLVGWLVAWSNEARRGEAGFGWYGVAWNKD